MKCAVVKFSDSNTPYSFKTVLELEKGDNVVADTVNGLKVVKVVKVSDIAPKIATKWIICKVDLEEHKERLEKESKLEDVKARMKQRKKYLEEIDVFKSLAKEDKEMKDLLSEFEDLEM